MWEDKTFPRGDTQKNGDSTASLTEAILIHLYHQTDALQITPAQAHPIRVFSIRIPPHRHPRRHQEKSIRARPSRHPLHVTAPHLRSGVLYAQRLQSGACARFGGGSAGDWRAGQGGRGQ